MTMSTEYKTTIGLEIHAELKTNTKMFCGCKNDPHCAEPNTNICEVCTAQPGTLPVVNKQAVEKVLLVGKALESNLATFSEFDRKNYFYPDIPKAYQISQYAYPLVSGGSLAEVEITRIHLEEDTARNLHDKTSGSVVDFNRSGVPLMELVTEPVIHDAETAGKFARELQLLLRTLGASDANMEKGEMRVEANISVSKTDELGTKVEVKNLNSFKSVESAIEYEVRRQIELLEAGEKVTQETRGWDENKARTFSQRSKETADDYRYFPDPDITKYDLAQIKDFSAPRLDEKLPEIPSKTRLSWLELGLSEATIEVLLQDKVLKELFISTVSELGSSDNAKLVSNYVSSDVQGLLAVGGKELYEGAPRTLAKLCEMLANSKINSRVAKDLLPEVVFDGIDPEKVAQERGLIQDSSLEALSELVQQILTDNDKAVAEYRDGKESAVKFLVGQGMKLSKGTANPQLLEQALLSELSTGK